MFFLSPEQGIWTKGHWESWIKKSDPCLPVIPPCSESQGFEGGEGHQRLQRLIKKKFDVMKSRAVLPLLTHSPSSQQAEDPTAVSGSPALCRAGRQLLSSASAACWFARAEAPCRGRFPLQSATCVFPPPARPRPVLSAPVATLCPIARQL